MTQTTEPWFRSRRPISPQEQEMWGRERWHSLTQVCNKVLHKCNSKRPYSTCTKVYHKSSLCYIPAPLNYVTFSSLSPPLEVTEKWRLPRGKIKQRFVIIIIDISPLADSAISRKLVLENSPGWLRRTSATTTLKRYTYILPIPPIPGNFCRVLPELNAVWKKAWP